MATRRQQTKIIPIHASIDNTPSDLLLLIVFVYHLLKSILYLENDSNPLLLRFYLLLSDGIDPVDCCVPSVLVADDMLDNNYPQH